MTNANKAVPVFSRPGFWFCFFLVAYNNLSNLMPSAIHSRIYIGMNIFVLVLVLLWSRRFLDLKRQDLGLVGQGSVKSLVFGICLTLIVILPFVILIWLLPKIGWHIPVPRLDITTQTSFWLKIFFRIPFGTAFFEEMLFRGIFFGYLAKKHTANKTIWLTSLFFTLWHFVPALKVVNFNYQIGVIMLGFAMWLLSLIGAFIAGLAFAWIRARTRNITGCIIAHILINDLALVIIYYFWRG